MMKLGIKNRLFFHPAKLNNILDINLNKISVSDILKNDDLAIIISNTIIIFFI